MSKENRKINFIIRGFLLLMFLVVIPLYAALTSCTDEKERVEVEYPKDLPKVEKLVIKKRQQSRSLTAITVDYKGHDVIIIAGHPKHFREVCEKCRKEMGLPPN